VGQEPFSLEQGILFIKASRSYPGTPQAIWLLWTSEHPDAETSISTTHNTHNRQISMHQARFEPAIPASELPQTHDLDGAATGISGNRS